jgi:hypothetical protein
MSDIKSALSKRFEKTPGKETKMDKLATRSSEGSLTSFSGVFKVNALSESEKVSLQEILESYREEKQDFRVDFEALIAITSEVKAINNQAIILHGERIRKAQMIFSKYKDGAFSAWLIATYGNRQTPYNFLQYYEFYSLFSEAMQKCIDLMPKQVIYTLATRSAEIKEKESFILSFKGETKSELLAKLRDLFPLEESDLRKQKVPEQLLQTLEKALKLSERKAFRPTKGEKESLIQLLTQIKEKVENIRPLNH